MKLDHFPLGTLPQPSRDVRRGHATSRRNKTSGPRPEGVFAYLDYASGWWYTYPSETYESQLGLLFPIYMEKTCSKPPTRLYCSVDTSN